MTLVSVWSIGILEYEIFILESNVGPMNTTHQLSDVMLTFDNPHIRVTYVC